MTKRKHIVVGSPNNDCEHRTIQPDPALDGWGYCADCGDRGFPLTAEAAGQHPCCGSYYEHRIDCPGAEMKRDCPCHECHCDQVANLEGLSTLVGAPPGTYRDKNGDEWEWTGHDGACRMEGLWFRWADHDPRYAPFTRIGDLPAETADVLKRLDERKAVSVPEPPPVTTERSEDVTEHLLDWLRSRNEGKEYGVCALIRKRRNYGVEKYGVTLMSHNGRDCIEDALQEAGDLLQYICQAQMEGRGDEMRERLTDVMEAIIDLAGDWA